MSTTTLQNTSAPIGGTRIGSIPTEERRSLRRTAKYFYEQYQYGLQRRAFHARTWLAVESILQGLHFFEINQAGVWKEIPRREGEIRETVPVIKPRLRHILGFLNSNEPGVTTIPVASGSRPGYTAERAQDVLTNWIIEARIAEVQDRQNQFLLTQGMCGLLRYQDAHRRNVFIKALPGAQLFPIPFDATDFAQCDGLIYASVASEQFLELQDLLYARSSGETDFPRMAQKAKAGMGGMSTDFPIIGPWSVHGSVSKGAITLEVWMKDSELNPGGEYAFLVGDEIFRHAIGTDPATGRPRAEQAMPGGEIPIEIIYFDKHPNHFWGYGPAESLLSSQFAADRQMTAYSRSARRNTGVRLFDTDSIGVAKFEQMEQLAEDKGSLPFKSSALRTDQKSPIIDIPSRSLNRDVGAVLQLALQNADAAAGMHSGILFGRQEGRTESGPATSQLSNNAMASFQPVMGRINFAWDRIYPAVLRDLKAVWPTEKVIRISGPQNLGREVKITRENFPSDGQVLVRSRSMIPGGAQTRASILFQLRTMPGPDGKPGSELTRGEFRHALQRLNLLPDGVKASGKTESRIQTRINQLIGDGARPTIPPASLDNPNERQQFEDHRAAVEMLLPVVLDDAFEVYGPMVQGALVQEFAYHRGMLEGIVRQPNQFDNDAEAHDAEQMERYFASDEADLDSMAGVMTGMGV